LGEGIWLQDLDALLPWGSKVEDLRGLWSPEISEDATSIHLYWRNHVAVGFSCDVMACRILDTVEPSAYLLYLDVFQWALLEWRGEPDWSVDDITLSFRSTYEELRRSFGDATFCQPGYAYTRWGTREGSLPSIHWELGTIRIGLSAQFPCHLVERRKHLRPELLNAEFLLSVANEPAGNEELKAAARLHEERHGAKGRGRVSGVVW
jgi:hypothetical protein